MKQKDTTSNTMHNQNLFLGGFIILRFGLLISIIGGFDLFSVTLVAILMTTCIAYLLALAKTGMVESSGPGSIGVFIALLVYLTSTDIVYTLIVLIATLGSTMTGIGWARETNRRRFNQGT